MNNKELQDYLKNKKPYEVKSIMKQLKPLAPNVEYLPNMMTGQKNEISPKSRVYLPENIKNGEIKRVYRKENINRLVPVENQAFMRKSPFTRALFNMQDVKSVFPKFNAKSNLVRKFPNHWQKYLTAYEQGAPIFDRITMVQYIDQKAPLLPVSLIKDYIVKYNDSKIKALVALSARGINAEHVKVASKIARARDITALLPVFDRQKALGIPDVIRIGPYRRDVVSDIISFLDENDLTLLKQVLDSGFMSKELIQAFVKNSQVIRKIPGLQKLENAGLNRPKIIRAYLLFGRNVIPHIKKMQNIQNDPQKLSSFLKTLQSDIPASNIEYLNKFEGDEQAWKNMIRRQGFDERYAARLRTQYGQLPSSNMLNVMRHSTNYGRTFKKNIGISKMRKTNENTSSNEER